MVGRGKIFAGKVLMDSRFKFLLLILFSCFILIFFFFIGYYYGVNVYQNILNNPLKFCANLTLKTIIH